MAKCKINQRKKGNKCVKRTGYFKFFNRKTKNPFRLVGSYTGAILGIIYLMFATKFFLFDTRDIILLLGFSLHPQTNGFITATVLAIVIGFFIGYAIQLILRLFRK